MSSSWRASTAAATTILAAILAGACGAAPRGSDDATPHEGHAHPVAPFAIPQPRVVVRPGTWQRVYISPDFEQRDDDRDPVCGHDLRGGELTLGDDEKQTWRVYGGAADCEKSLHARHWDAGVFVGVEPYRVFASDVAASSGPHTIFSLQPSCAALLDPSAACPTDFEETQWVLLSVVGPVATVISYVEQAGGGGPPYSHESWTTVDLRTGRPAALDALVTEASLVGALKGSTEVLDHLDGAGAARLASAQNLGEVLDAWGVRSAASFGGYALVADGRTGDHVTLRLGVLWSHVGMLPNILDRLDLDVEIRPEAARWVADARAGRGYLASSWPEVE